MFYGILIGIGIMLILQSILSIVYLARGQQDDELIISIVLYGSPVVWFIMLYSCFLKIRQKICKYRHSNKDFLRYNINDKKIYRLTREQYEIERKKDHGAWCWRQCDCVINSDIYLALKKYLPWTYSKARCYILNYVTHCYEFCGENILKHFDYYIS